MSAKITVYSSWFIFAIWAYIFLIYLIGFLYFWRIPTRNAFYDRRAFLANLLLFIPNLVGQVFTVYLFLEQGKDLIDSELATTTEYWILVSINLFLIVCYLVFFLVFSNNLAVKMTDTHIYLLGMSVLNSAIIRVKELEKGSLILEYVYKHEANKKWTEELKFYSFFPSTAFVRQNYLRFFDPEKNLAFFDLHNVSKQGDDKSSFSSSGTAISDVSVKEKKDTVVTKTNDFKDKKNH